MHLSESQDRSQKNIRHLSAVLHHLFDVLSLSKSCLSCHGHQVDLDYHTPLFESIASFVLDISIYGFAEIAVLLAASLLLFLLSSSCPGFGGSGRAVFVPWSRWSDQGPVGPLRDRHRVPAWCPAAVPLIRFSGPSPFCISRTRHRRSDFIIHLVPPLGSHLSYSPLAV